jgi:hypothetical protein
VGRQSGGNVVLIFDGLEESNVIDRHNGSDRFTATLEDYTLLGRKQPGSPRSQIRCGPIPYSPKP